MGVEDVIREEIEKIRDLKLLEKYYPESVADAIIREIVSLIPVIGDILLAYEMLGAIDNDDYLIAAIYGASALPEPTLPLTHLIVYGLRGRKR